MRFYQLYFCYTVLFFVFFHPSNFCLVNALNYCNICYRGIKTITSKIHINIQVFGFFFDQIDSFNFFWTDSLQFTEFLNIGPIDRMSVSGNFLIQYYNLAIFIEIKHWALLDLQQVWWWFGFDFFLERIHFGWFVEKDIFVMQNGRKCNCFAFSLSRFFSLINSDSDSIRFIKANLYLEFCSRRFWH